MANESKKQYVIEGKIVGTYKSDNVDIDISLSDSELERIKDLIKSSNSKDLRWVIQDEFPEVYEQINDQLVNAAYEYYAQEYKDYFSESEDDEEDSNDIELTGEEYSCPIPKEWYAKYKFKVMVALTYEDEDIEVEVPLSDKEVDKIKQLIAENNIEEEPEDEEEYVPPTDLLQILDDNDKKLFDKFWWDTIYPRVFIKMLVNGLENGYIEKYDEDDFDYDNEDDFDDIQDMYSDDIELEHSSCCICRIPEDWKTQ